MATDFGKRLRAAREHAGLTQKELAAKAGMAQSTLGAAEAAGHGSRKTPQLAAACGVDAHWLATGDGEMVRGLRPLASEPQAPAYRSLHIGEALPMVLEALANLPAGRWSMVKARLDDLIGHPEMRDDVATDILLLLQASAGPISKRLAA